MIEIIEKLQQVQEEANTVLKNVDSSEALESWRVTFIGRKGSLSLLLRQLKDVPAEHRQEAGKTANAIRAELEEAYSNKKQELEGTEQEATLETVTTASGIDQIGHIHPLTITLQRIQQIFSAMGFEIIEGPEVEDVKHSFDYLNIPEDHPARSESDTFYLTDGNVLRVQTSSMQVRAVKALKKKPPFSMLFPGRVFRSERTDATHETTFNQFEGLVVGDDISIADFKGIIETFFSTFFGKESTIRLRPSYFPFVEPGFEVDVSCVFCDKAGCRVCKHTGWIEVMGAGIVHPNVLTNMGLDPKKYQGFAFGGAIDRLTMLRHAITDIRLFWSGDIRFLKQFS